MSEGNWVKRLGKSVEGHRSSTRRLSGYVTAIVALLFLLMGLSGILVAASIEGEATNIFGLALPAKDSVVFNVLRELGIALFTLGALGVAYEFWLKRHSITDIEESLKRVYEERQQFSEAGLKKIHERLNFALLEERCNKAREIRILQTWLGHDLGAIGRIEEAASNECKIDILLLDPLSAQVRYRASVLERLIDEELSMTTLRSQLEFLCKLSHKRQKDGKSNVRVKVYDAAPTIQMYEFDRIKLIGMYWREDYSIYGPQFEIVDSETSFLARQIDKHFDALWDDKKSTRDASEALKEYKHWKDNGHTNASLTLEEHQYWKSTGLGIDEYRDWKSTDLSLKEYNPHSAPTNEHNRNYL